METLAELYEEGVNRREPYLQRARDAASLTVPTLFPEEWSDGSFDFEDPYQAIGALGVASLSSKLQLAYFPPGLQFHETQFDPGALDLEHQAGGEEAVAAAIADKELRDKVITYHLENETFRTRMTEALDNLVVGGNILLRERSDGQGFRLHRLPSYIVERDAEDDPLAVVVMEKVSRRGTQSQEVLDLFEGQEKELPVFTGWIKRAGSKAWDTWSEIKGKRIKDTEGEYPSFEMVPVHPSRFGPCCGEPYGRGIVDRVIGDLASLEGLAQSTVELAAEAARLVWLHEPNGDTSPDMLAEAPNGAHRWGRADEVSALRLDKLPDMQLILGTAQGLRGDLATAFFMRQGAQRDAERVTAVEVQMLAQELDETQGGVYSVGSVEIQSPVLRITSAQLVRQGRIHQIGKKDPLKTRIVAGIEGLGRGIRFRQMNSFLSAALRVPKDQDVGHELDRRAIFEDLARSSGVGTRGVLRSPADVKKRRAAEAKAAQQAQLGPEMLRQGADLMKTQVKP